LQDILLHTSIAGELTHTFPPKAPFMAGVSLSYHVGMDLVTALLNRYGGVPIIDLVTRYCPTLFITIDMLTVFLLVRRLTGLGGAGVVAALLVVLGEDLSFIPGLLQKETSIWTITYFRAPSVYSLYLFNPMVMALGLLFASLFCIYRSLETQRWVWIIAAALCSAAMIQTKIFVFIQLGLAMALASAFSFLIFRRKVFLRQGVGLILVALPLMLYTFSTNSSGGKIVWILSSGLDNYVIPSLQRAHLPLLVTYSVMGCFAWLVLTYGFRVVGIGKLIQSLREAREQPFWLLLAVFVLLGPILTLTSRIVPVGDPHSYNNAIWFMVQSKYVATIFAVAGISLIWGSIGWMRQILIILIIAIASLTSSVQQFVKMSGNSNLNEIPASVVEVFNFMNNEGLPGDMVVTPLNEDVLSLSKFRVPIYPFPFISSFASFDEITKRKRDMEWFWQSWQRGVVREDILIKYRADWILSPLATVHNGVLEWSQITLGKLQLKQVIKNNDYVVYKVMPR
jgi:hypothetical protein